VAFGSQLWSVVLASDQNSVMSPGERVSRPRQQSAYVAGGWIVLACLVVAIAVELSLPGSWQSSPESRREVFRPEWLILATLVVLCVHRAARACWWLVLPATALPTLQLADATETALARLHHAGFATEATSWWWLLPVAQLSVLLAGATAGALASMADRRWERFMLRRLGPQARRSGAFDFAA
jgi:hypothetical protein